MPSKREDYLEGEVLDTLLRLFVLGATSQLWLPTCTASCRKGYRNANTTGTMGQGASPTRELG